MGRVPSALGAIASLWLVGALAAPASGPAEYTLRPERSTVWIHVDKTGLFSAFGHEHTVIAPVDSGRLTLPRADGTGGRVAVSFQSRRLRVSPAGEPAGDAPKVQATMQGPEVLDVERYPRIRFVSDQVSATASGPGAFDVQFEGRLSLHGVTRRVSGTARAQQASGVLRATGELRIRQTDFGISPVSAGGGTVKVEDELRIAFTLVGTPAT